LHLAAGLLMDMCACSPYDTAQFHKFAEPVPAPGDSAPIDKSASPTLAMLSETAKEAGVYVVGGSIAELLASRADAEKPCLFNTSTVWGPDGALLARHRKVHLFDIDVPGRITFKESATLTAGDSATSFDTPWGRIGLGICYDLRFPQLSSIMRYEHNCSMFIFPGAFNTTTGPAHWELLLRSRALDHQVFVLACSPARNPSAAYQAYGHSSVVDPWGTVLATTEHEEGIVYGVVDHDRVDEVRGNIPVSKQRRTDLYEDVRTKTEAERGGGVLGSARAACVQFGSSFKGFF
jgi:omega-amidase